MPTGSTVFRCKKDNNGRFESEGSSYEWNRDYNNQPMNAPRNRSSVSARLMYDYDNFHSGGTNGSKTVLHADGHVEKL